MSEKCKAKSKQSGERCKRRPSIGREVCVMHGGGSPRGAASPNFKHGRYSKELPKDLLVTFQNSLGDPGLLELQREVSLVDARVSQLLKQVDTEASAADWQKATYALRALKRATLKRDKPAANDAMSKLEEILEVGNSQHGAWNEISSLVTLRRKLSDSQTKREERLGRFIETRRVAVLMSALTDALRSEVRDPNTLRNIGVSFNSIVDAYEAQRLLLPADNQTVE